MGLTAQDVHDAVFSRPRIGRRGYNEGEVDQLLDRIVAELERRERDPAGAAQLTGADVRSARFGKPPMGKRGYNEDEVDLLLELVADELDRSSAHPVARQTPGRSAPAAAAGGSAGTSTLYASPATLQRVIEMVRAESEVLAQWPQAAQARTNAPAVAIYVVE